MSDVAPVGGASGTARAAAGMGAVTAGSRVLGFVRVLVVAAVLGTTYLGNAFGAANSLSNVLFELLAAGALSAVLVPTFVDLLDRGDRPGAQEVAGGVLGIALVGMGVVTVIGVIGAPLLARLLTIGVPSAVAEDAEELVTYLVRFFIPQVVLYAAGTVAIAVLYSRRRFAVTAAAPIANTVVMIACLATFRAVAGPDPGLDLTAGERWWLVAAGTGGVIAFVTVLLVACERSGFRLRPRRPRGDPRVTAVLRHSGWGVVLHTGAGLLLGAAIVAGAAVEGGVVAYQVGWVFFLAPYAVLAQPIHTTILPELVGEARTEGREQVAGSLRWALERMALFVVPVSGALVALALPAMRLVSFGDTDAGLLAAALAGLAVGLFPYGAFLLFARGYYALGDSRTPGVASLGCALVGMAVMALGAVVLDGAARVAMLGVGHSVAYAVGAVTLAIGLTGRTGGSLWPAGFGRMALTTAVVGTAAWLASSWSLGDDPSRMADLVVLGIVGTAGALAIVAGYHALGVPAALTPRGTARALPSNPPPEVLA